MNRDEKRRILRSMRINKKKIPKEYRKDIYKEWIKREKEKDKEREP